MVLRIPQARFRLHVRGFHPLRPAFPKQFCSARSLFLRSLPRGARTPVWALSLSLAATKEIDVSFSSSGYLDVSVRRVPPACLWIQHTVTGTSCRVSPFGYPWVDGYLLLSTAFRSLSRPSSAPGAKASTLRSFLLGHFADLSAGSIALLPWPVRFQTLLIFSRMSFLLSACLPACLQINRLYFSMQFSRYKPFIS